MATSTHAIRLAYMLTSMVYACEVQNKFRIYDEELVLIIQHFILILCINPLISAFSQVIVIFLQHAMYHIDLVNAYKFFKTLFKVWCGRYSLGCLPDTLKRS